MKCRCAYCYYGLGDTIEHIMPKCVTKLIKTNEGNTVPACRRCNSIKGSAIYIPTISNIYGVFRYFTNEQLYEYACYIYKYYDILDVTVAKPNIPLHDDEGEVVYYYTKDYLRHDLEQFYILWDNGYFEDLNSHRVPSVS